MENEVNDDNRPLPSTPTTTGLAWNEATSLFVNTGDLSPVTAGMFLSLAAEGDNATSTNDSVSPDRALLIQRHRTIENLSIASPRKQIFKNAVSSAYVKNKKQQLHCDHELQPSSGLLSARKQLSFSPPTNSTAPKAKEQSSPPKPSPSVCVGKSIDPPKSKTKNSLKPRRPNFNWKTAPSRTFENLEKARSFITTNYPLLRKRSSKPNARYLPNGTTHEYQCFVAKTQRGFCRAHLEERIGQCFALKVNIVGDCACGGDGTLNGRGVSPQDALVLNSVMKDNPKLKPKAMAGEVLKALVQEESPSVSSPELRSLLANKLKNKIKRQFIRERMLGTRSSNVTNLKDLFETKQMMGLTLPQHPNPSIKSEDNLKQWGSSLFDKGYLRVAPCDGISNTRSQAYNLMTILHSTNSMPPNNASNSEKNLYAHLQKLQGQSKKSDDQVWDKIVCFSSLSLLYNVVRCRILSYQVTASADGFHGTCSNDWHVLTFGVFAPKEDGSRSYRPFLFILCPSEKEIYFTAGLLVLVRFIDGLFGVRDFNFEGGIVTDHTEVFVTPCTVAFPFSVNLQCFPHIHRKFLIGKANGDYSTHRSMDKKWFQGSAASDVQSLYQCISKPMFDTLAKLTKESWLARGEKRLVEVFFKSYINKEYFNVWYVGSSGIAGCIPQNQANERATLELKGTSKFDGLCAIGKNIGSMLTEELPKAIYMMSLQRTSLCRTFPILNSNRIFNKKSNFHIKFAQYCSLVDKQIDIRTVTEGTPIRYLNSEDSLGKMVTATRVETYEKSVAGTNSHLFVHSERHLYIDSVHSLCKVKCSRMGISSDGTMQRFYEGSCVAYLESRCCVHAAYLQYGKSTEMKQMLTAVPNSRPRRTKIGRGVGYKGEFIQLLNQTGTNMHNATKCLINNSVKNNFMRSIANNPAISTLVVKFNIRQRNRSFVDKHMSLVKEALKHSCDIADVANQMVSNPSMLDDRSTL
eukprot:jgi/Psemu1/40953/gm1.40953_g